MKVLNWFFGLFFWFIGLIFYLVLGINYVVITMLLISAFILPPVRNYVYSKTKIKISGVVRAIIVLSLLIFGVNTANKLHARLELEKEKAETIRNIIYFNNNKEKVLALVKEYFEKEDFKGVVSESEIYLSANDKELEELYNQAQNEIGIIKTKEILKLLKNIPMSEYEKNKTLYEKLVHYNPNVTKYEHKLKFYSEKLQEQKSKKRKEIEDYKKAQETPEEFVKIIKQSWRTDGFGTIAVVNLTVKNMAPFDVKDIIFLCNFYGNSGTRLNSIEKQVFEIIQWDETRTFKNIELGFINSQATRGGCRVGFAKIS